jgi:hypothetical protein
MSVRRARLQPCLPALRRALRTSTSVRRARLQPCLPALRRAPRTSISVRRARLQPCLAPLGRSRVVSADSSIETSPTVTGHAG